MTKKKPILKYVFITTVLIFVYLPIISMIIFSFNDDNSLTRWKGFSFRWYGALFQDKVILDAIILTLIISIISTVVSVIIGTLISVSLTKQRKVIRDVTLSLNNFPILNPEIVTAIALFLLFSAVSISRGYTTMLLSHIAFSVPYVVVTVYPKMQSLDPNLSDAAYDLGANPFQVISKVILPQLKGAIIAGAAIAFTMSFDDFSISYYAVQGEAIQNISIYLYKLKRPTPVINALSTIIVGVIIIKVIFDFVKSKNKHIQEES